MLSDLYQFHADNLSGSAGEDQTRIVNSLDLYWRTLESGDLWCKSGGSKRRFGGGRDDGEDRTSDLREQHPHHHDLMFAFFYGRGTPVGSALEPTPGGGPRARTLAIDELKLWVRQLLERERPCDRRASGR